MPSLVGDPVAGSTIAFKTLELSADYTPEVSDYKEAQVLAYDALTKRVTLKHLAPPPSKPTPEEMYNEDGEFLGRKFDLPPDDEYVVDDGSGGEIVTVGLGDVLEGKIVV
ncbi:hypothetical protein HK097_010448 [Rhizophlyctis rosea]|uniref:Coilin tudor domain-containing protein n=1 Tax=Rhizophlyctis rosea TaxID=64517 RepID=A0AAD5S9W4_9FUNG|nr:hypothetical protein HK097_010448 [Rhizophlyctis rosea]